MFLFWCMHVWKIRFVGYKPLCIPCIWFWSKTTLVESCPLLVGLFWKHRHKATAQTKLGRQGTAMFQRWKLEWSGGGPFEVILQDSHSYLLANKLLASINVSQLKPWAVCPANLSFPMITSTVNQSKCL